MADKLCLIFEIEDKSDFELILGASGTIPEDELHIQTGTKYARKLKCLNSKVSFALVAKADRRFNCSNYAVGYIQTAKLVFNRAQARPLLINHGMVQRGMTEFNNNSLYPTYNIEVIVPSMDIHEFLISRNALAPYATPSRAYREQSPQHTH